MNSTSKVTPKSTLIIKCTVENFDIMKGPFYQTLLSNALGISADDVEVEYDEPHLERAGMVEFLREYMAHHKLPKNEAYNRIASEIGVSRDTLLRWYRNGVPTTGNKRNQDAIDKFFSLMCEYPQD